MNVKHILWKVLATSSLDMAGRKLHKYRSIPSDNSVLHPHKSMVQRKCTFHLWATDNSQMLKKRYGHNCTKWSMFAKLTRGDRWLPLRPLSHSHAKGFSDNAIENIICLIFFLFAFSIFNKIVHVIKTLMW